MKSDIMTLADEVAENRELRKFLKRVGVNSQRIIEAYRGSRSNISLTLQLTQSPEDSVQSVHVFKYGDKDDS
jgi:hypothetical protein